MAGSGQRELILEQRHLLGVFFGVVLIGAVSFAAGFFLGRSRGEQDAADKYASVAAAVPPSAGAEAAGDSAKPDASNLTFFDSVEGKQPAATPQATQRPSTSAVPSAPKPAATSAAKTIYLQVGAFSEEAQATTLVERLEKLGFTARTVAPTTDKLYRVQAGPYASDELADAAKRRLEAHGFRPLRR